MKKCSIPGCEAKYHAKGLCSNHYHQQKVLSSKEKCSVSGCDSAPSIKALCNKHYQRMKNNGHTDRTIGEAGTGYITPRGYRRIYVNGVYIEEHRYVMEQQLGRPLRAGENVHHMNGDRLDNRPANLELWAIHQPKGQRVEDLLKWAKEIISLYDDHPSK